MAAVSGGGCGFVLVAGGLGERLGYSGIKVQLPSQLTTGTTYLELYIRHILALQGSGAPLPLAIMTSAAPTLLLGLLVLGLLPDSPAEARWLTGEQKKTLATLLASDGSAAASLPLCAALRAALRRPHTWLFGAQHFVAAQAFYCLVYFGPTQLREVLPSLPLSLLGCVGALPSAVSLLVGPTLSERADRSRDADNSPTRGRFRAAWLGTTLALLCILASGLMLLLGASLAAAGHASSPRPLLGMPPATLCSGLALLATWLAVPAASFSAGPFWALHHASQPAELRAVSAR